MSDETVKLKQAIVEAYRLLGLADEIDIEKEMFEAQDVGAAEIVFMLKNWAKDHKELCPLEDQPKFVRFS